MKILFNDYGATSGCKTYKTRENAIKAAEKLLGNCVANHRVLVATNEEGRFFPVAVGQLAMQDGVHFHMPVVG
jgi:hypothetical protein